MYLGYIDLWKNNGILESEENSISSYFSWSMMPFVIKTELKEDINTDFDCVFITALTFDHCVFIDI